MSLSNLAHLAAAVRRGDRVERRPPAVRPAIAVGCRVEVEQAWVELAARLVIDAELLRDARPEVVQHDVRLRDQPVGDLLALRLLQVERDALFPLRHRKGEQSVCGVAAKVAAWDLHANHAGAQIRQHAGRVGCGDPLRKIDDGDAGQRPLTGRRRGPVRFARGGAEARVVMFAELGRGRSDRRVVRRKAHQRAHLLGGLAVEARHVDDVAVVEHLAVRDRLSWPADALYRDVLERIEDGSPLVVRLRAHALQDDLPERLRVRFVGDGRQLGEAFVAVDVQQVQRLHLREAEMIDCVRELEPDAVLGDRSQVVGTRYAERRPVHLARVVGLRLVALVAAELLAAAHELLQEHRRGLSLRLRPLLA